ncbi:uncharacterized protein LOC124594449 [Schistocerca americana]|uniref:uncharacterized protein LOC124594449 n=1 Tax=Schistocerca americana TaxID=7009 RepID=UPI001F4F92CB|nr:uncharacterized protein LOC124594449 [Schistocerca americana]
MRRASVIPRYFRVEAEAEGNKQISHEASHRLRVNMYNLGSRVLSAVMDVFSYGSRSTIHLLRLLIAAQKMRKRLTPAVLPHKFYYTLRSLLDSINDVAIKQLAVSYAKPLKPHLDAHELYFLRSRRHKTRTYICCPKGVCSYDKM